MIRNSMKKLLFGMLVFASLLLHIYKLDSVPGSLHNDEVANTYAGRFIFENGKDLFGNKNPWLYMDKFGDYPPVIPMYVSAVGTYILGINEFGSRIGISVLGALTVIPFFLVALHIYKRYVIAYFLAITFTFLPWHFVLSRSNAEGVVALFIYMWGFYFILKSENSRGVLLFLIGVLALCSTYLLYPSYRIFIPLTFIAFILHAILIKNVLLVRRSLLALFITILLTATISLTNWGKGRFNQTSIFTDLSGVQISINQLTYNESNTVTARIFNNKVVGYGSKFIEQYLEYYSPKFLFTYGGYALVYKVPYFALLFYSFLLIIGIYLFLYNKTKINISHRTLIILILLFAPIPAALTIVETPNIHRSLQMSPFFILLLGIPIMILIKAKHKILYLTFISIAFFVESIFFFHNYFQHASFVQAPYRNDGNKQLVEFLINSRKKYTKIYVTNREAWLPATYLLFSNDFNRKYIGNFNENFRVNMISNIYFPNSNCLEEYMMSELSSHILYVLPNDCNVDLDRFENIHNIKKSDQTTAFGLYLLR